MALNDRPGSSSGRGAEPFHETFLGGQAEIRQAPHNGGNTFIAERQIGYLVNNFNGPTYQYGNNGSPEHSPILEWLWPVSSLATTENAKQNTLHRTASEARQAQSVPWIFGRAEFNDWLSGGSLWIRGKVGCGKTTLFSAIVNHVQSLCRDDNGKRLGYYYCRFQNSGKGDLRLLLKRWLAQVIGKDAIPEPVQTLYHSCCDSYPPREPTCDELFEALISILNYHNASEGLGQNARGQAVTTKFFLLVDALDEITSDDNDSEIALATLSRIADLRLPNVCFLATSRDRADIREHMQPTCAEMLMNYTAIDGEIAQYVSRAIHSTPRLNRQTTEIKTAIVNRLASEANGMFLWVALQMRLLRSTRVITQDSINRLLGGLPDSLTETYRRILESIPSEHAATALLALKWIILAKRSLFIEEVVEACAFRPASSLQMESDTTRLRAYNIFELLQDLVVIEPHIDPELPEGTLRRRTHVVSIAHVSLIEYLTESVERQIAHPFRFSPGDGHKQIAIACICYLFHLNTPDSSCDDGMHALLQYAWYNWEKHVLLPEEKEEYGHIRHKALVLIEELKEEYQPSGVLMVSASRFPSFRDLISWLPRRNLGLLVRALRTPYFHPNYSEFVTLKPEVSNPYHPIDIELKEIRVIHILPSLDVEEGTFCRLEVVRLDEGTLFDAISYAWGAMDRGTTIYLNGIETWVGQSLQNILEPLAAREENQGRAIWVDALCINMTDLEERSRQVRIMASIFKSAQDVVFCVGQNQNDHEDRVAIEAIADLASSIGIPDQSHQDQLPRQHEFSIISMLGTLFWRRSWIVQEIVLSRRGTILLGSRSFPLRLLEEIFGVIRQYQDGEQDRNLPNSRFQFLLDSNLQHVRETIWTRLDHKAGRVFRLSELLCRFAKHECTSLHDKVYSLLGLLDPHLPDITVDYSKPLPLVFLDAASVGVNLDKDLNILSHVTSENLNKPTWLPMYENRTVPLQPCSRHQPLFSAGGPQATLHSMHIDKGSGILKVKGVQLGKIERCFDIDRPDPRAPRSLAVTASGLRREIAFTLMKDCMRPFWDTFAAGQSFSGYRLSASSISVFQFPPTTEEEERELASRWELWEWPDFRMARCFFTTSSQSIGMGPVNMERGDMLALFTGAPVPYVVRQLPANYDGESRWQFLGECYVHGIMDGEAITDDATWETFTLV